MMIMIPAILLFTSMYRVYDYTEWHAIGDEHAVQIN